MSRSQVALGDAITAVFDNRGKTPKKLGGDWSVSGHRVVSALNIKGHRVDENDHHYISDDLYRKWMKEPLRAGDVLLTSEAPTGEVAFLDRDVDWALGQRLFALRALPGLLDGQFLYYSLRGGDVRHQLLARSTGTTVSGVRQSELLKVTLDLPPIEEQVTIAATLGMLDAKIQSSHEIVRLICGLIRAQVTKSLDANGTSVSVARLARFVNGGAFTKGASGNGRMVLRIAELNSGPGGSTVYSDIEVPEDKTARAGDLLMSWSGSLGIYRWFRDEAIINQHIFKVIPTDYPSWFVFDRLEAVMPVFQSIAKDKATTMGHIQRGHLESTPVEIPPLDVIDRLDTALGPLWERLLLAEKEIVRLAALRDALLPALLSGRLRILEAGEVFV